MENEEKNIENIENSQSMFDDTNISGSMFGEIQEEIIDSVEEAPQATQEETTQEVQEESAEAIAEKMSEEIKKATEEINEPLEENPQETSKEELPSFLKDIEETTEKKEESIPIEPVVKQENFVSTIDDFEEESSETDKMVTVRPVKFQQFEDTPPNRAIKKNLDIMQDISMHISVELGRTKSSIKEVMEMEQGSIVELDKIAGEQVEVFVNGKLVAKGEVIVIEDKFGVRVTSTSFPKTIQ